MSAIDQINQGGTTYEIVPEIAELFSISKTYHAGDHVIYEAGWYTFKADKYAGTWDATKVDGPFKVTNELSSLKNTLSDTIDHVFAKADVTYALADIPNVTKRATSNGTCSSTAVTIANNADYDTYWFIADKTYEIYANQNGNNYYAMIRMNNFSGWATHSTYIDGTGTDGVRYRNTEGNLPTSENPLTINAGTLISITVPKNTTAGLTFQNQRSDTLLNNSVVLNSAQIAQVKNKTMLLQYVSGNGVDSSTERLYVYYPMSEGYIRYSFIHCVSTAQNCNIWRMSHAYKCSDNLVEEVQITTTGEWECAVQIQGRPDFSGGYVHGDEMVQTIDWFIDGKNVSSFADYATPQAISSLECIQYSNLYDPNDHETVVAQHGSIHTFNAENNGGLTIKQSVKWLGSYTLSNSYLAMLPILKTVSDTIITDVAWNPTAITLDYTQANVKETILYKAGGNIKVVFSFPYKLDYTGSGTLLLTDNGGQAYNKTYYFACQNGATVSNGSLWRTVTEYKITS